MPTPRPYFFPVYNRSTPVWKWETILVSFSYLSAETFKTLPYPPNTTIMVESGGLSVSQPIDQLDLIYRQLRLIPDPSIILTYDFPIKQLTSDKGFCPKCYRILSNLDFRCPSCGTNVPKKARLLDLSESIKKKLVQKTISNAVIAMKYREHYQERYKSKAEPMAVIQGYDLKSLEYCTRELVDLGYKSFGFGVATTSAGSRNLEKLTENLTTVRDIIGKHAWLHLLGVTAIVPLVKWKGMYDSFDSALCTITAINATLINKDGPPTKLTSNHPLHPTTIGYLRLMEINFINYVKRLEKTLWLEHF